MAADYRADVVLTYDANTGILTLSTAALLACVSRAAPRASLPRAPLTCAGSRLRPRRVSGKDPTAALALALSAVTYQHASLAPDASPRAVTFLVTDALGSSSRPTVAVVNILRAWLRLVPRLSAPLRNSARSPWRTRKAPPVLPTTPARAVVALRLRQCCAP